MRYRPLTCPEDFSNDVATFIDLVGVNEYQKLLLKLGQGLRHKGYVLRSEELKFSLEKELFSLEKFRVDCAGKFPMLPAELHNAISFLIGLGQTIPQLSDAAKKRLRGKIVGGLKTGGLTSLNHEMRVAALLNNLGFDVAFHDLETGCGFDFLATKNDMEFEVEVKSVSTYTGAQFEPEALEHLHLRINKDFVGWSDSNKIPIITITLKSFLEDKPQILTSLVGAVNQAASTMSSVEIPQAKVSFIGAMADTTSERVNLAMQVDFLTNGAWAGSKMSDPKCIIRVVQNRGHKLYEKIEKSILEASKNQFSHNRPSIIWVHQEFTTSKYFDSFAGPSTEKGMGLDKIVLRAFDLSKRAHLVQLVFSGGSFVQSDGKIYQSSCRRVVYDSHLSSLKSPLVFPGGRKLVDREIH